MSHSKNRSLVADINETEILEMLAQDITNKDLRSAKLRVEAIMDRLFDTIRYNSRENRAPKKVTQSLTAAVRRIERTDMIAALDVAYYIERVAGAACPSEGPLRNAMAAKAVGGVTWITSTDLTLKAEKMAQRIRTRAKKAGVRLG